MFMILLHSNKQCTLYDLCQHKAILNTSFTMHQILRKIQKTCTTYMQNTTNFASWIENNVLVNRWGCIVLASMSLVGPKLCILPEMQSHRSATHEPETGHYQRNLMWRKLHQLHCKTIFYFTGQLIENKWYIQ